MSDLTKAIKSLEPLARDILALAAHADKLDKLEVKVNELQGNFEQRQGEWAEAEMAAKKARAYVVEANAEAMTIRGQIEHQRENASARAAEILAEAKREAVVAAKEVSAGFVAEHEALRAKIKATREELAVIEGGIAERQKTHDAVQASIDALSRRLVGAA